MSEEARKATHTAVEIDALGRYHVLGEKPVETDDIADIQVPTTAVPHWLEIDTVATAAAHLKLLVLIEKAIEKNWTYAIRVRPLHGSTSHKDPLAIGVGSNGRLTTSPSCADGQPIALRGSPTELLDRAFDLAASGCTVTLASASSPASTPAPEAP